MLAGEVKEEQGVECYVMSLMRQLYGDPRCVHNESFAAAQGL